jgi:hypothetical protein
MLTQLNRASFSFHAGALIVFAFIFTACSSATATPIPQTRLPTQAAAFCKLKVVGNQIQDTKGNVFVLHGANLPTIAEMEASPQKPPQRLQDLADAGAKLVRLPVDESELLPTFVPEKLRPVIEQANQLGLVIVVRYRNNPQKTLNTQADEAEDFLRLVLSYPVGYSPGLWFEPFDQPIPHARNRGATQAMVDVVRGLKSESIMLITNIEEDSKDASKLLGGNNLVYGITDMELMSAYPTDKVPFVFPNWLSRSVAEDDLKISVIAQRYEKGAEGLTGKILREYWQKQNAKYGNNLLGC